MFIPLKLSNYTERIKNDSSLKKKKSKKKKKEKVEEGVSKGQVLLNQIVQMKANETCDDSQ